MSFLVWGDYSWNLKIKDKINNQDLVLVYEQNSVGHLFRPWTWFKVPIMGLWYIDSKDCTKISENILLCKIVRIQYHYSETEYYEYYNLVNLNKFGLYFPSEEELRLLAVNKLNIDGIEWNKFNDDTPGIALLNYVSLNKYELVNNQ